MKPYLNFLNRCVNDNHSLFKDIPQSVNWVKKSTAPELEFVREELKNSLNKKVNHSFKHTKPWYYSLSKGCELCGQGKWSCLFINGICNANCFFCPSSQRNDDLPASQMKIFNTPKEYADYVSFFGYKGVSISGGEPFLTTERTLEYIRAIREYCDEDIYMWLYTNGLASNEEAFKQLQDQNLNEIRFNLNASNYNWQPLELAAKYIENITVEIPAVPEDFDRLLSLIPKLINIGVTNLNLHQLRITPYNAKELLKRKYTYTHGVFPTVIESELTAYELLKTISDKGYKIGVNYCNYNFKNNFQKAGYKNILAQKLIEKNQEITEMGYLRTIQPANRPEAFLTKEMLVKSSDSVSEILLNYTSLSLRDYGGDSNDFELKIGDKNYKVFKTQLVSNLKMTTKLYLEIDDLLTPKSIKEDELFKIYLLEKSTNDFDEYY